MRRDAGDWRMARIPCTGAIAYPEQALEGVRVLEASFDKAIGIELFGLLPSIDEKRNASPQHGDKEGVVEAADVVERAQLHTEDRHRVVR